MVMAAQMPSLEELADPRVYVRDRHTGCRFLADTGSSCSFFPEHISKQSVPLRLPFYGDPSPAPAGAETLRTVDFGHGLRFRWRFLLSDRAIIGADFLAFYGLVVDMHSQKLLTLSLRTLRLEDTSWNIGDVTDERLPPPRVGDHGGDPRVVIEGQAPTGYQLNLVVSTGIVFSQYACLPEVQDIPYRDSKEDECDATDDCKLSFHTPNDKTVEWNFERRARNDHLLACDALMALGLCVDCRHKRLMQSPDTQLNEETKDTL